jgi:hypothetical protein
MSDNVPAEIKAWIDCARCGRIEKPAFSVSIPPGLANPMLNKVCLPCGCCGVPAIMHLHRAVRQMP